MKAIWNGQVLAESNETVVVENNHYFPASSLNKAYFVESQHETGCPWKGKASYYSISVLFLSLISLCAEANTGIPGPMMIAFGGSTAAPLQWIAATMFMCIGIEAAIYKYVRIFKKPIIASLIVNVISLVAGFPLGLLGFIDLNSISTVILLPTVASIVIELVVLYWLPNKIAGRANSTISFAKFYGAIILANIFTNMIMAGYLYWLYKFFNNDMIS